MKNTEPTVTLTPKWMSVQTAAKWSGFSDRHIEELARTGQIVSSNALQEGKSRGRRLILVESLDAFIMAGIDRPPAQLAMNPGKEDGPPPIPKEPEQPKGPEGTVLRSPLAPKWLTLPMAAKYASLSERFLEDLAKTGQVATSHVIQNGKTRGRVLVSVESIDALILAGTGRDPVKLEMNAQRSKPHVLQDRLTDDLAKRIAEIAAKATRKEIAEAFPELGIDDGEAPGPQDPAIK